METTSASIGDALSLQWSATVAANSCRKSRISRPECSRWTLASTTKHYRPKSNVPIQNSASERTHVGVAMRAGLRNTGSLFHRATVTACFVMKIFCSRRKVLRVIRHELFCQRGDGKTCEDGDSPQAVGGFAPCYTHYEVQYL